MLLKMINIPLQTRDIFLYLGKRCLLLNTVMHVANLCATITKYGLLLKIMPFCNISNLLIISS